MQFMINKEPVLIREVVKDDGTFPNSPLPVLIYKKAIDLPEAEDDAAKILEEVFARQHWCNAWRNGIYDYHHYHSITHEVLGVYYGSTRVELGGAAGFNARIERGDIIIIPAGVAHRNLDPGAEFKCVGAYPGGGDYDIKKGEEGDRPEADRNIKKVPLPEQDPVYEKGPLLTYWQ